MVSVDEVPDWAIGEGRIGHVAAFWNKGWLVTACNLWSPSFELTKEKPRRICRECRQLLKTARWITPPTV